MAGSLLGAVVGLALGVGAKVLFGGVAGITDAWPAAVVGVLAGFAMRTLAASGKTSALRGALAAAAAVGGVIGGDVATAAFIQSQGPSARIAKVDAAPKPDTTDEAAEADAEAPAPEVDAKAVVKRDPAIGLTRPQRQTDDVSTMIWLGASALVAYGLGQGAKSGASGGDQAAEGDDRPPMPPAVDPAD
ncbi:MAG: hypothetical protein ACRCT8_02360 [Lacipirellulaceae bacterium]